jgi:hypothetical protein
MHRMLKIPWEDRRMRVSKTPGKQLVATLSATLADGVEWTEREQVALGLIAETADRVAVLKKLFAAEIAKPEVSTRRVTELSAEVRQCETSIAKLIASLDPDMVQAKSARHVHAANARWHRGAAG